ncbi:aldo/keto reductase [Candidatus Mycobacterium methanotrophicum]|uniref:aldo/keto reductase n=1 Tax=Candidatus Mycobacterium methanotrophicum TaxID=2943498 RepID=UPI001C574BEC
MIKAPTAEAHARYGRGAAARCGVCAPKNHSRAATSTGHRRRGRTLAQLALAWVLRNQTITSALVGVSSVAQLDENLGALDNLDFTSEELSEIDQHAVESGIDTHWRSSSDL